MDRKMLSSSKGFARAKVMIKNQFHTSLWGLELSSDRNGWPPSKLHGYCSLCLSLHLQISMTRNLPFTTPWKRGLNYPILKTRLWVICCRKCKLYVWSVSFYPRIHSCVCMLPGSRHRAPTKSPLLLLFSLWSEGTRPHSRYSTASIT